MSGEMLAVLAKRNACHITSFCPRKKNQKISVTIEYGTSGVFRSITANCQSFCTASSEGFERIAMSGWWVVPRICSFSLRTKAKSHCVTLFTVL